MARATAGWHLARNGVADEVAGKRSATALARAAGGWLLGGLRLDDRAYTCYGADEGEFAVCLDAANGKTLWKTRLSDLLKNDSYGDGPAPCRPSMPAAFTSLAGRGASLLDAANGRSFGAGSLDQVRRQTARVWLRRLAGGNRRHARCGLGAGGGKSLAAFDKADGKIRWTALDDRIGYSTPLAVTVDGVPQSLSLPARPW